MTKRILSLVIRHKCIYNVQRMSISATSSSKATGAEVLVEGKAEILAGPKVFYNPVQEFNRDLSIAVLTVLSKIEENNHKKDKDGSVKEANNGLRVLEALSATGLRSIRYAKEVPGIKEIVANDISEAAVNIIQRNIEHNGVQHLVTSSLSDASSLMYENRHYSKRFDAVDLDPYGCPTPFLDGAVQCVKDKGILLVTCTDMAVLCGNSPNTCYVKYGAVSLKHKACHELALRIVLQCIEAHANKYKRYIVPLLSISVDFYIRVFVQIFTSAAVCKRTTSKLSHMYHCTGCDSFTLEPLGLVKQVTNENTTDCKYYLPNVPNVGDRCQHCNSRHHMGGPVWSAPIHDSFFITKLLETVEDREFATKKRLIGVLSVIREEILDVPLYHIVDRLCSVVHATTIPMMTIRSALLNGGYKVSYSHASKKSIKTNAPMLFVWDVIRHWVQLNPVSYKNILPDSPGHVLLSKEPSHSVDFSPRADANPMSREMKLVRYQENPTAYWGPGTRSIFNVDKPEKSKRNQNKKRNRQNTSPVDDGKNKTIKVDETVTGSRETS